MRRLLGGTVATAFTVLSCGGDEVPALAVVRDSLGIEIVDNSAIPAAALPTWTLPTTPALVLGTTDGSEVAEQFNQVVGATRLESGSLVVADGGSRELRFFDANGQHVKTVGGIGEGPGELGRLFSLDRIRGDTLIANDWPVGNAAWFDSTGVFLFNSLLGPYWPGLTGHFLPDGSLLADTYEHRSYGNEIEMWAAGGTEEIFRPQGWMVRMLRDSTVDTLRAVHGEEWFRTGVWRQNLWIAPLPFAHHTKVTWNADHVFVGETEQPQVEVLNHSGSIIRLIRWSSEPVSVTRADRRAFETSALDRARPGRRAHVVNWIDGVRYREAKPAFKEIGTDRLGRLFVRHWETAGVPTVDWLVFGLGGQLAARIPVPTDLELLEIGETYVLALWRNELDVEFVRVYDLRK